MRKPMYESVKKRQVKLDKIRKEEWIAMHKRVTTNFARFNDTEERKMYRSRKKYLESSVETFIAREEKSSCFEGIFPMCRLNSVMISTPDRYTLNPKLFLIGGLSSQMSTKLHFHSYEPSTHHW